jgi:hypothetical protein
VNHGVWATFLVSGSDCFEIKSENQNTEHKAMSTHRFTSSSVKASVFVPAARISDSTASVPVPALLPAFAPADAAREPVHASVPASATAHLDSVTAPVPELPAFAPADTVREPEHAGVPATATAHLDSVADVPPRVAWVTLVMKGDSYTPGALVVGHSLRRSQTRAELVVMVTEDVSAIARAHLALVFDHVIDVRTLAVWLCDDFLEFYDVGGDMRERSRDRIYVCLCMIVDPHWHV